jgi:hypothetical protein
MVTAHLKSIVLHWVAGDRPEAVGQEHYEPPDPANFAVNVQALIGSDDSVEADSFDFTVCSPKWLATNAEQLRDAEDDLLPASVLIDRGIWLMASWSPRDVETSIRRLCEHVSPGPDWGTVADRLGRWMPWEYDYRYDEFRDSQPKDGFPPGPERA